MMRFLQRVRCQFFDHEYHVTNEGNYCIVYCSVCNKILHKFIVLVEPPILPLGYPYHSYN